ncbi:MAG: hypothetical protein IPM42_07145 [Saprospiraceae bacterium]|nr:hypothetical protein [Saprospiraceae bacterium]
MRIKIAVLFLILVACKKDNTPKLTIPEDKLVMMMVDMYTIKATVQMNHESYKDSTRSAYYSQMEKIYNFPVSEIKKNFEELAKNQDSMMIIQNRAMDTIRVLQERNLKTTPPNQY